MKFLGFSKWLQQESVLGSIEGAITNVPHKITHAVKTAAWGAAHPAKVPPAIGKLIADEWKSLVQEYGTTEAVIIFATLVVTLGPGLMVPGSMILFWVALGSCKLFNHIVGKTPHTGETKLSDEQVHQVAERVKEDLLRKAEKLEDTAR